MATLNDFNYTDNVHDVLAVYVNRLLAATLRSEYKNVQTLSGDMELTDGDTPIQRLDCNGSNRIVNLPSTNAVSNHAYLIINASGGSEILSINSNDDAITYAGLEPGKSALMLPDGAGGYVKSSGDEPVMLSATSPRVYTSNDIWNKPDGLVYVIVELVGGGGAGGGAIVTAPGSYSCGGGGGGGGYSKKRIASSDLGSSETVTIGAGGTGVSGAGGNTGGTTSFGSHLQATGGVGGAASAASSSVAFINPGTGGIGSGGNINVAGSPGMPGARSAAPHGGGGGGNPLGGGGVGQTEVSTFNGNAGRAYGGGGSGAANGADQGSRPGANGAAGVVIVWECVYGVDA